jgi:hypothetical protein
MNKKIKTLIIFSIAALIFIMARNISYEMVSAGFPVSIEEPTQIAMTEEKMIEISTEEGKYVLTTRATYEINAVVKSVKRYSKDRGSVISKVDFALAWGELNKPEVDRHISYSQSGRWYYFKYDQQTPVDIEYISHHSSNVHLIAASDDVDQRLSKIRKNDFIGLQGYLVDVAGENFTWKSSLSREDRGNGACEVLYVTNVIIHE